MTKRVECEVCFETLEFPKEWDNDEGACIKCIEFEREHADELGLTHQEVRKRMTKAYREQADEDAYWDSIRAADESRATKLPDVGAYWELYPEPTDDETISRHAELVHRIGGMKLVDTVFGIPLCEHCRRGVVTAADWMEMKATGQAERDEWLCVPCDHAKQYGEPDCEWVNDDEELSPADMERYRQFISMKPWTERIRDTMERLALTKELKQGGQ